MRQSIMEDAKQFSRDGECFIHVEKAKDGYFKVILTGDPAMILQGVFNVLSRLEVVAGLPVKDALKILMKGYKKVGIHKPAMVYEDEEKVC